MYAITTRSSYDQCVEVIDEAVKEVLLDQPDIEAGEDEIWADLAASLLLDANPKVAEEVCRCQLGYVPAGLRAVWALRIKAKREQAALKSQERQQKLMKEKKDAEAAQRRAEVQAVRDARCPRCFIVKTPAGQCNC